MTAVTSSSAQVRTTRFNSLVVDVRGCTRCDRVAHSHVLGEANGRLDASVVFVAEAVGRRGGAITGVPLTQDEPGRRFATFVEIAGIRREDAFVTNAMLCNPLDAAGRNRTPLSTEIAACRPFLERTLDLVYAPVVVTLGRVALESMRAIVPHDADLRRDVATPIVWRERTLIPMYHPSRQSTLHRPHEQQVADWRRLGEVLRKRRVG